jgi:catechol 2,3-dioxygenase-like lactoylglutathione lyase family enzyme
MFRHVGIVTKDIQQQLKFYKDLLELEIYYNQQEGGKYLENLLGIKNTTANIYKLGKNNQIFIELLSFKESNDSLNKKLNDFGITHFAITVENIDKLYNNMKNNNVFFITEPIVTDSNKNKVCFCKDYDGNYIELVENL